MKSNTLQNNLYSKNYAFTQPSLFNVLQFIYLYNIQNIEKEKIHKYYAISQYNMAHT